MLNIKDINEVNQRVSLVMNFVEWTFLETRTKLDFIRKLTELLNEIGKVESS